LGGDVFEKFSSNAACATIIPDKLYLINPSFYDNNIEQITDLIAEKSGIYAFYPNLPKLENATSEDVLSILMRTHHPVYEPSARGRGFGLYDEYELKFKSRNFNEFSSREKLKKSLDILLQDSGFSSSVSLLTDFSILFAQPMYVGAASNLKRRLKQHFEGKSDLKEMFSKGSISKDGGDNHIEQSIFDTKILIFYLQQFEELADESIKPPEQVLEELAQRLYRPPFVRRIG